MNTRQKTNIRRFLLPALRSGVYAQGRRVLRLSENAFCCLGVACDLMGHKRWTKDNGEYNAYVFRDPFFDNESDGVLTFGAQQVFGLSATGSFCSVSGVFPDTDDVPEDVRGMFHFTLAALNDKGVTFADIADILEWALDTPLGRFDNTALTTSDVDMDAAEAAIEARMAELGIAVPALV